VRPLLWAALVGLGALLLVLMPGPPGAEGFAADPQVEERRGLVSVEDGRALTLERFSEVAEFATDAVVRVESRMNAPATQQERAQHPGVPDLREFYERFFGPGAGQPRQPTPRVAGGSGVIVSEDGIILTNAHVVQGRELTVWLDDRRSFPAELVGMDPTTDVAVLDIDADGLPTLPLGDSDELRVGEWVMAIGSPGVGGGQLEQTVTAGIVSAIGRPLGIVGEGLLQDPRTREFAGYAVENFIQIDAVINPGNSGGPLVDLDGAVVGINTAIASPTGYFLGYGFAVPSNLVVSVVDDIVQYGEVRRAQLGVTVTTVSPEDAEYFGLDEVRGVLVQGSTQDGPAAEAGLRQGDVILALDGERIDRVGQLQQKVAERSPGDTTEVTIVRDGEERAIRVTLGETNLPRVDEPVAEGEAAVLDRLGLSVGELTPERRSMLGHDDSVEGAVIMQVSAFSSAARRGIREGDVITAVGDQPVSSASEVSSRLDEVEAGEVTALRLLGPGGTERIVTLRVPA
jgi:serine protease Do